MALAALISFEKLSKAPAWCIAGMTKFSRATNHIGRTDGRPFPLPSAVDFPVPPPDHFPTCQNFRRPARKRDFNHRNRSSFDRRTNKPSACGVITDGVASVCTSDDDFNG